jgi:hypothetical protein
MTMREPTLKFAVTCPDCALQSLSEVSIAVIANALLTGKSIRLHAGCHDQYWTATFIEREQLRQNLAALNADAVHPTTTPSHASRNPQFETNP